MDLNRHTVPRAGWLAAAVAIFLLATAGILQGTRPAQALTNCTVSSSDLAFASEEQDLVNLINQYRAQNNVAPLKRSTNLEQAAAWMARSLATGANFDHTDSAGRNPSVRAVNCGYPYANSTGENIGAGTNWSQAQAEFDGWKASPGHNANMLNASYKVIGVAHVYNPNDPGSGGNASAKYKNYWVADFGTQDDHAAPGGGGSTPTATATSTPTSTPVSNTKAAITAPAPGSTLGGSSATFSWSAGKNATSYVLSIGSTAGGTNYLNRTTTTTSTTATGLPTNGAARTSR
jgi:uncharacterized protein YkwD